MRRLISILLLLFISASSFYGGYKLIVDPTGQSIGFNVEWMSGLFKSFLIPGIILFFFIGGGSVTTAIMAFVFAKRYPLAIILTGGVLIVWIIVQLLVLQKTSFLQPVIGGIGIILLALGLLEGRPQVKAIHQV